MPVTVATSLPICTATAEIVLTLERRRDGQWNVCALKPGKSTIGNTPTPCRLHLCPEKVFTCGSPVLLHCIVGGGAAGAGGTGDGDGGDGCGGGFGGGIGEGGGCGGDGCESTCTTLSGLNGCDGVLVVLAYGSALLP